MAYTVELSKPAQRDLARFERDIARRIRLALESLRHDSRPHGCVKMAGERDRFRIRVGAYRVVYRIDDPNGCAVVLRIQHRREVYR